MQVDTWGLLPQCPPRPRWKRDLEGTPWGGCGAQISQIVEEACACEQECWGGGAWVAQSVKRLTSAQVTISLFLSLSPESGSVLTARSLGPASDSASVFLPSPAQSLSLTLALSKIKKHFKK